jgi:SAM-dependent methyltransferase
MGTQNDYGRRTAQHYAAYRPPLHAMILSKCLPRDSLFAAGLDIGCGTGYSAIALKEYCSEVTGIEPSEEMLQHSVYCPGVTYLRGSGEVMPVQDSCADIITFAGSLFYAEVPKVAAEVRRVARGEVIVVCYDFAIDLKRLIRETGFMIEKPEGTYDHCVNFSQERDFIPLEIKEETIAFVLEDLQAMHILLSNPAVLRECAIRFPGLEAEELILQKLQGRSHEVTIKLYDSVYCLRN